METTSAVNTTGLSNHSVSVTTVTEYGEFPYSVCIDFVTVVTADGDFASFGRDNWDQSVDQPSDEY